MHPERNLIESAQFIVENRLQNELITAFASEYKIPRDHENFKKIKEVHVSLDRLANELMSHFEPQIQSEHMRVKPELARGDADGGDADHSETRNTKLRGAGHLARLTDNLEYYHGQLTGDRPNRIRFLKQIGKK